MSYSPIRSSALDLHHRTLALKHHTREGFLEHVGLLLPRPYMMHFYGVCRYHLSQQLVPQVNEYYAFRAMSLGRHGIRLQLVWFEATRRVVHQLRLDANGLNHLQLLYGSRKRN